MEEGIREILREYYPKMMQEITDAKLMARSIKVLTPLDCERIEAESRERGDTNGMFELLNRLQKRGPKAFPQLLQALRQHHHRDLAEELQNKAETRNLYRGPRHVSADLPDNAPIARGPWNDVRLPSPVQPSSAGNQVTEEMHSSKLYPSLPHIKTPYPADLQIPKDGNPQQIKNKGQDTLLKNIPSKLKEKIVSKLNIDAALNKNWKGIAGELQLTAEEQGEIGALKNPMDELFKQMAYKEYHVIDLVKMLLRIERNDVVSEFSDAGYYSQDQEEDDNALPSPSQVSRESECGSFEEKGFAKRSTGDVPFSLSQVSDQGSEDNFTKPLNEEKAKPSSGDVPFSPTQASDQGPEDVFTKPLDEEKKLAKRPTVGLPSPTKETELGSEDVKKPSDDEKSKPSTGDVPFSPTQVSDQGSDNVFTKPLDEEKELAKRPTVGLPSPTKATELGSEDVKKPSDDERKGDGSRSNTMGTLPSPTKESENKRKVVPRLSEEAEPGKNEDQNEITDMITNVQETLDTHVNAKGIFISCEKYEGMSQLTKLNKHVKDLFRHFEDHSWKVTWKKDCKSANMKIELQELDKTDVYFVYLAGHTLQINGENYLLPIDIELNLATADIVDCSLNINNLVKELSEKALMAIVIVDGGHFNEGQFESPIALTGLTSIAPPSNTVIAFPCQPGYIRPQAEMLLYLKALINVIKEEEEELAVTTLFTKVKEALRTDSGRSPPVEFSLSRSLLPICLHFPEEEVILEEKGVTIQMPTKDASYRAIVFSDPSFDKLKGSNTVKTGTEYMKTSLNQLVWEVEVFTKFKPKDIKVKVRQTFERLEQERTHVFMLYFIGYVVKDVSIQWLINMMSQYVTGPKVLVVDDPSATVPELTAPSELPQNVLLCLPKISKWREEECFTLNLAQNLSASPHSSLKSVVEATAKKLKHQQVVSELFYL